MHLLYEPHEKIVPTPTLQSLPLLWTFFINPNKESLLSRQLRASFFFLFRHFNPHSVLKNFTFKISLNYYFYLNFTHCETIVGLSIFFITFVCILVNILIRILVHLRSGARHSHLQKKKKKNTITKCRISCRASLILAFHLLSSSFWTWTPLASPFAHFFLHSFFLPASDSYYYFRTSTTFIYENCEL